MGLRKRKERNSFRAAEVNFTEDSDVAFATAEAFRVKNWKRKQDDFRGFIENFTRLFGITIFLISIFTAFNRLIYYNDGVKVAVFQLISSGCCVTTLLMTELRNTSGIACAVSGILALLLLFMFAREPQDYLRSQCFPIATIYFIFSWPALYQSNQNIKPRAGNKAMLLRHRSSNSLGTKIGTKSISKEKSK